MTSRLSRRTSARPKSISTGDGTKSQDSMDDNRSHMTKEKQIAFTSIEQQMTEIHSVGADIWRYSELPEHEEKSHRRITQFLAKKGFKVHENYMGHPHAFRAEFGEGEIGGMHTHPNICLLCQYDATAKGHLHGNNLVVVNALTAALGLQTVIKFATEPMGRVTVMGCPNNFDNTNKTIMFEQNMFRNIDFVLCAYPASYTCMAPKFLASKSYTVTYTGRDHDDEGRKYETSNPVNAVVLAYQNIGVARAHFQSEWQAKGVITSAGNQDNLLPQKATMEWQFRAPKPDAIALLEAKCIKCLQAAATATGCLMEIKHSKKEFVNNISTTMLRDLYINNAELNGYTFYNVNEEIQEPDDIALLSTSIPVLKVFYYHGDASKRGTPEFMRYVGSTDCEFAQVVQGKTLAMLGVDLMMSEEMMKVVFEQHQKELGKIYSGRSPSVNDAIH